MKKAAAFLLVNLAFISASVIVAASAAYIIPPLQEFMVDQPLALVAVGACLVAVGIGYLWALCRILNHLAHRANRRTP